MASRFNLSQPNRFRHLERWDATGGTALSRRRQYVEDFIAHFGTQHRLALGPLVGGAGDVAAALATVFPAAFRDRLARSLVTVRDEDLPICMDTALWGELQGYFARPGSHRSRG